MTKSKERYITLKELAISLSLMGLMAIIFSIICFKVGFVDGQFQGGIATLKNMPHATTTSITTTASTTTTSSYITATLIQCGIDQSTNGTQLCNYQLPKGCIDEYYLFPQPSLNMQYGITCTESGQRNLPLIAQENWTGG